MTPLGQSVRENLRLALDTLRSHKVRSILTVLGVLIGTATVIAVASIIAGLNRQMVDHLEEFGTRSIWVYKFEPGIKSINPSREERMRRPLTYEDGAAIREQCAAVERVSVTLLRWGWVSARYKGQEMANTVFRGMDPEGFRVSSFNLADGRLYTSVDNLHRREVAVIGAEVVKRFFELEDPVGKTIIVDGHAFEIIGTMTRRKEFLGNTGSDQIIFIPYLTYRKLYPEAKEHFIAATARQGKMDEAIDQISGLLRRRRHVKPSEPDSFGIATAESIINQFHQITATVALVMVVLSSIGLLVGGIGVMNIMLVSVTERTREIGVRKAIGARRSDITWQFLLEAVTLTTLGGSVGILVGWTLSFLIRTLVPSLPSTVPVWSVVTGVVVSVSVGLFFGMWPALKAARLDPIVALRYE